MTAMEARRRLLMIGGELPGIYRRVEYLEANGTQMMQTGITGLCEFDVVAQGVAPIGSTQILLGRGANGGQYFGLVGSTGGSALWTLGGGENFSGVSAFDWTNIHASFELINELSSATITIGNASINRKSAYTEIWREYTLFSGSQSYRANARIKSCICYKDGNKVLNFIPCVRKSDNKPGMYDTVTKTFYTNSGTGEFIVPS